MELYGIGNAILYFRTKDEISQLQVCDGICPVATLSRIETGEREFDSIMSETLLGRLGKTANRFEFVIDEEDYRLYELREQIKYGIDKNLSNTESFLSAYEKKMPEDQVLHEQFLQFYRTLFLKSKGGEREEVVSGLYQAIDMTRADFKTRPKNMMLFSPMEVKIIYELFLYENYSVGTIYSLFQFMEKFYDVEQKEQVFLPFLYGLVTTYEREKNYHKIVEISEEAIAIICEGRSYSYLADFYFWKIKGEEELYCHSKEWETRKSRLIEECCHTYYLYSIEEDNKKMEQISSFCEEKLQCQIIR